MEKANKDIAAEQAAARGCPEWCNAHKGDYEGYQQTLDARSEDDVKITLNSCKRRRWMSGRFCR